MNISDFLYMIPMILFVGIVFITFYIIYLDFYKK